MNDSNHAAGVYPSRQITGNLALTLRLGYREISFGRDTRIRCYRVNKLVEFSAGANAGHVEILFFRRWLLVLSRAAVRTVIA